MNKMIHVYILSNDKEIPNLERIFSGKMYEPEMVMCPIFESPEEEIEHVYKCLRDAWKKGYTDIIIIKDTSVSTNTPEQIENILKVNVEQGGYDILYLCKWLDRCDLYTNLQVLETGNIIVKTQAPRGIQAIMLKQCGIEKLLGEIPLPDGRVFGITEGRSLSECLIEEITVGNIDANAIVPNVFFFDLNKCRKQSDYIKSMECVLPPNQDLSLKANQKNDYKFSSYVLLVIFLIILCIGIYFLVYSRGSKPKSPPKV